MSQCTHVAGCIRVDDIRLLSGGIGLAGILGKPIRYYENGERGHPTRLPCGSEGSLDYLIWVNPMTPHLAAYTVSVFGDLRDYDDVEEILRWLVRVTINEGLVIRDAVLSVDVEFREKLLMVHRRDGDLTWIEQIVVRDAPATAGLKSRNPTVGADEDGVSLEWHCHICGQLRPDAQIGVAKHDTSEEAGLPPGTMQQNVRYCRDKPECVEGAKTFRHFRHTCRTED